MDNNRYMSAIAEEVLKEPLFFKPEKPTKRDNQIVKADNRRKNKTARKARKKNKR